MANIDLNSGHVVAAFVHVDQGLNVSSGITIGVRDIEGTDLLTTSATIAQHGNITTQGTITCVSNLSAASIYTKTEVNSLLAQKQPTASLKSLQQLIREL